MAQDIWINLPVKDLTQSAAFFTQIGFAPHPGPGNSDQSASFTIGDKKIVLTLFMQNVFTGFTNNALSDTVKGTEVLFSLGADSREQVNEITKRVREAGGTIYAEPNESHGFMYGCGFCDPDGHRWNMLFMDPSKMPK
ncbi:MAG: glyoxalase/bleomycin resistance/extradiol dioxygenase family protein [Methylobacter sp.]|nr:glyoxalase/bleomycin resistance/extradiol dioxygenase family protein [Methylobacter sp.]